MDHAARTIRRFRRRVAFLLTLSYSLAGLTAYAFLWGAVVLVLRGAMGVERGPLVWGAVGAGPIIPIAFLLAVRRRPSAASVRALLDRGGRCGGLLMAADEVPLGGWTGRLPPVAAPRLRWRERRVWVLFPAALVFVLGSFLVPQRYAELRAGRPLAIGPEADRIAAKIEVLREESLLEASRAEELKDKLEQVRDEASGQDPVKTWEALDHLEGVVQQTAEKAGEDALAQAERLTESALLARALAEGSQALTPSQMTEAMGELAEMMSQAARENRRLARRLKNDPQAQQALDGGELSPEQLRRIAEMLRKGDADLSEQLERLAQAGLIDRQTLQALEERRQRGRFSEGDIQDLARFLAEQGQRKSAGQCVAQWLQGRQDLASGRPGKGGITRGPGDAAMTWTDGTREEGARFIPQVLPPGRLAEIEKSRLVGLSAGDPTKNEGHPDLHPGALRGASHGGGSAHTQQIWPRHRGAVKRYFERKKR